MTSDVALLCCEDGRVGVLLGCLDAGLFVCFDWFYLCVSRDARDLFGQAHHSPMGSEVLTLFTRLLQASAKD